MTVKKVKLFLHKCLIQIQCMHHQTVMTAVLGSSVGGIQIRVKKVCKVVI